MTGPGPAILLNYSPPAAWCDKRRREASETAALKFQLADGEGPVGP
ncbi:hypothetical protein MPC4_60184 [Methylocella tundrae]|uniref:Uncharacterized protein n=1 Tax=Methylocella tundrae TaxID=227605 RepID=A0A8B6MB03_METTU|nr:hypothetical protein MPC4_60184 [Methylocella tundrae]